VKRKGTSQHLLSIAAAVISPGSSHHPAPPGSRLNLPPHSPRAWVSTLWVFTKLCARTVKCEAKFVMLGGL
jgi:hypothetical protein